MAYDLTPLILTFKLASLTTLVLCLIGIPLAYWLGFCKSPWKHWLEAVISMPLVLPPTVLGFYLLVALGPKSLLGGLWEQLFNARLVFSFPGLVIGSTIFSLPFLVNPVKAGFENIPQALIDACDTLGKSRLISLWKVFLPNIRPAILTGLALSFAHTVGEFGVVLMIGGNIPHETRVASIAIFTEVEALNYQTANLYSLVLFVLSFAILAALYWANQKAERSLL